MDNRLFWETSLSFVLLLAAFVSLYYSLHKRTTFVRFSVIVLFVACGSPLAVISAMEMRNKSADANIGLGLAFFLTWGITVLVFLLSVTIWLVRLLRKRT